MTLHQSIPDVSREAGTEWRVIPHFALSVPATGPDTGVIAVIVPACLGLGTVAVDDTLRLAFSVGISEQSWRTGALAVVSNLAGDGPGTTGVGITRISNDWLG